MSKGGNIQHPTSNVQRSSRAGTAVYPALEVERWKLNVERFPIPSGGCHE